jgi:L-aminopeptidase/D-esterase-like protein
MNNIGTQLAQGLNRVISLDNDTATIRRGDITFTLDCRVSYQSGAVWNTKSSTEQGNTIDTTPYVLARTAADLKDGDIMIWRDRKFRIGVVTRPSLGGRSICMQAPLTELQPDD